VLQGGGYHGRTFAPYTHQFDVHGTVDCFENVLDIDIYPSGCGQAGHYFEITDNAFQYTNDNAIKFRGSPTREALV